ncbi:MAG TPA: hypothetical protein VNL14_12490 [Candidatus Acidoferrales bacterium]|nr:hypothetical protein [Candidatus Acidoferrales bacterium]
MRTNISQKLFFPSVGAVLFLSTFLSLSFFGGGRLLHDPDTGYHIRAGEFILSTFTVPRYDMFSFHQPPLPWTAHEWLSEVIMALVHRFFGLTGIVIFFSLALACTYYAHFRVLRAETREILVSTSFACLTIASSILHWLARPHIFSLIFVVAYQYVLDAYQYRQKNYLYLLPLLMLFWVNLHGAFIIGLVIVGVYLTGNAFKIFFSEDKERDETWRKLWGVAGVALACLLAALVNPYGIEHLMFPFRLVTDKFLMDHIQEYLSPNFHGTVPVRYLLFLAIVIFAFSRSNLDLVELLLVLLFTHMALYSVRYIPLFAIVVSPILARYAAPLTEEVGGALGRYLRSRSAFLFAVDSKFRGDLWLVAAAVLIYAAAAAGKISHRFDETKHPVAAVEFLRAQNLEGNMFSNDTFGDYLIYAAWPQYRVFVDGRIDMYGASVVKDYLKVTQVSPEWEQILDKYNISWIFESPAAPLSTLLLEREDWRLIYADKVAYVFVKTKGQNEHLIARFPNVKPERIAAGK